MPAPKRSTDRAEPHPVHPFMAAIRRPTDTPLPPRHELRFPSVIPPRGPTVAETRNVSVLTDLQNVVMYAVIPGRLVAAVAKSLTMAVRYNDQLRWDTTMNALMAHMANKGRRSDQAVSVLIAEQEAKARMESLQRLQTHRPPGEEAKEMGP